MAMNDTISIEVAYAAVNDQRVIELEVKPDTTVLEAIIASGIMTIYTEIQLESIKVGIYSKPVAISDCVKAGDRIEIYRPLTIDPKEARRAKANKLKS